MVGSEVGAVNYYAVGSIGGWGGGHSDATPLPLLLGIIVWLLLTRRISPKSIRDMTADSITAPSTARGIISRRLVRQASTIMMKKPIQALDMVERAPTSCCFCWEVVGYTGG